MMTIIGEVGGVMGLLTIAFAFVLTPCTYQKHELTVLKELEKRSSGHKCEKLAGNVEIPNFASFRFIVHDLKQFLRGLGLWPKLKAGQTELMQVLRERIDHAVADYFSFDCIMKIYDIEKKLMRFSF